MKLIILASLLSLCAANKIVGGDDAYKGQFPFIVHLDSDRVEAFCDGSIINPYWVLSAAHCKPSGQANKNRAVAGDHFLYDGFQEGEEQIRVTAKFIPHENYNSQTLDNDIMLVRVEMPFILNDWVKAITLPSERPPTDTPCLISGWGNTLSDGVNYPSTLQYIEVPVVDTETCNSPESYNGEIFPSMICIGAMEGGKDSCQGDSGGPVILSGHGDPYVQVGVVSWGYGCARPNLPGVYADVYYFVESNWIDDTMSAN